MLKLNVPLPEFISHAGFAQFDDALRQQFVERCTAWLQEKRRPLALELRNGRQLELRRNPVPDGSAVVIIEDVTERRQSEAKVLYLARHDSLTRLANRRELRECLDRIPVAESHAARNAHGGAVPGSRRLQAGQRSAWPYRRRRGAGDGRGAPAPDAAPRRIRGAPRAETSSLSSSKRRR